MRRRPQWLGYLGGVGFLLATCGPALAQDGELRAFNQTLKQCQSAKTPAQCRAALPACEQAQKVVASRPASTERHTIQDHLLSDLARCAEELGQYAQAAGHSRSLLLLREHRYGPEHPEVAAALNKLAELYRAEGQYAQAEPLAQRSLRIREKALGSEHPDVADSLNNLAELYRVQGQYAQAESLAQRSLRIREKALGPSHPDVADSLNNLAEIYCAQGQYAHAEPMHQRSLRIYEKALGPEHSYVATVLDNLALLHAAQGQYAQAKALHQRSLRIREKALGPDHPEVATALNNLAEVYRDQGQYAQAEPLLQRSLRIFEKALGPQHPSVAAALNNLALLFQAQGQYAQAEPLLQRSLRIREKVLGEEHPEVATSISNLAGLYKSQGQYAKAVPLLQRSLRIHEQTLGPEHRDVATTLNNLSAMYHAQGQYAQAEPLLQRSLRILEKALGAAHPEVVTTLNNLAALYHAQGQYAQAEPLVQRSLHIAEKTLGPEHPEVVTALNNLAGLYRSQGQYAQAEPLYQRSLRISEKVLGPEHPQVATALNHLAGLYRTEGRYADAEPLYQRSLHIRQKALGPEHPEVAVILNNLALLHDAQGQYASAERLYQRSLRISEKMLGPEHPQVATFLGNLAGLYRTQGRYADAEPLYQRSLRIHEQTLSSEHPEVSDALDNLASLYLSQGSPAQALPYLQKVAQSREAQLRATLSEVRMQALLDMLRREEDVIYGLLLGPELKGANELALQVALLRKGRVAAAGAAANRLLQRSLGRPELAAQFQEWRAVRQQHEALLFRGLGKLAPSSYRQRLRDTKLRAESLEAQLASALPELRSVQPPPPESIVPEVAAKLKPGSALVEVVWARPYLGRANPDGKGWGTPQLVALLLFPDRRIEAVPLGEAGELDAQSRALLSALSSPGTDPVPAAQALYRRVMQPLRAKLGTVRELYLSLDGPLNEIPFDALHDGTDYLLGRMQFHYLTSGRDLLRSRSERLPSAALVLANPDFGHAEAGPANMGPETLYARLAGLSVLPGTGWEAEQVAQRLGVKPLLRGAAQEQVVRAAVAPRILHIATHGLFLSDIELPAPSGSGEVRSIFDQGRERSKQVGAESAEPLPGAQGSMNRSALVLAGVLASYRRGQTDADGLLTAEEARSLDLDGTQLVVLSACETGRGRLSVGQGVYGLRRAFLVAGAETVVTSLWRVSDAATGELMTAYYQKLLDPTQPGDRLGAMLEAMQELRAKKDRAHPYYWAPFLVIGSAGPLR